MSRNNLLSTFKYNFPDTTIREFPFFFPRNYLGNLGLASPEYELRNNTPDLGFIFFQAPTTIDRFLDDEVEYFRSKGPFANLTGIAGSNELQIFKLLFTQTYKDKVNITLKFNRYTSNGFYKRQQAYTNNFYASSNFETKNERFGYYFYILSNSNKNNENGGLQRGRLNDTTVTMLKEILPVNLSGASRDNREFIAEVNPYFKLSAKKDSAASFNHYIQLKSKFTNQTFQYNDRGIYNDGFYQTFNFDTLNTRDSSHFRKFSNDFSYTYLSKMKNLGFSLGYKNEVSQLYQIESTSFANNILHGDVLYKIKIGKKDTLGKGEKLLENRVNVQSVLEGVNYGNQKIDAQSILTLSEVKRNKIFVNALFEIRTPDQIYRTWQSNHFLWNNNQFLNQERLHLNAGLMLSSRVQVSVFHQSVKNILYFNESALPEQYSGTVLNSGVTAAFNAILFKHLGLSLSHTYQNTSKKEYLRIPANITTAKVFFNGNLFKNSLQLQLGSQIQIYESFTPYAYMPATQSFYLQNRSNTAAFPFVDIYMSARIRPVSFFFRLENLLAGSAGNDFFLVRGYYQQDRAIRFGLSWMFFD